MTHWHEIRGSSASWIERVEAKQAGFRVWLEDRGWDEMIQMLDDLMLEPEDFCHELDEGFRTFEQWFSTFWQNYWAKAPQDQQVELHLHNRIVEAQNAQDYREC